MFSRELNTRGYTEDWALINRTMKVKEESYINPSNEFHILRHFAYVSEEYKIHLIGKEYWYYDHGEEKYIL